MYDIGLQTPESTVTVEYLVLLIAKSRTFLIGTDPINNGNLRRLLYQISIDHSKWRSSDYVWRALLDET